MDGTLITGDGETVRFTVDGAEFELDLTVENAAAFRAAVAPYIEAARRVRRDEPRTAGAGRVSRAQRAEREARLGKIRTWANENGLEAPARGRVPAEIVDAYEAAHA